MDSDCIFCRIVRGEIPSTRVLETDQAVAFRDAHPQAPVHVLVVPREHVSGFGALPAASATWNDLLAAAQEVVRRERLETGYRLVVNNGADGGQTVAHLHIHILGGRPLTWPPG